MRVEGKSGNDFFDRFVKIFRRPYFKKQKDGSKQHTTNLITDNAIEFIKNNDKNKPFCLSLSFNAPHAEDKDLTDHFPWPKSSDGLYEDITMPPPRISKKMAFGSLPSFFNNSLHTERYGWRWDTEEKYQKNMRAYFRMITGIDTAIGRIRQVLSTMNLSDNTVIIYTSDNGLFMGERGLAGKWNHFEESVRVPFIIYDPSLPKFIRGKISDKLVLNLDVAPTILDFANCSIPKSYQGKSVKSLLNTDGNTSWRKDFLFEFLMDSHGKIPQWEGVRSDKYVYARYFNQQPIYEFLHDLEKDPDQLINFAKEPTYQDLLYEMRRQCDTHTKINI